MIAFSPFANFGIQSEERHIRMKKIFFVAVLTLLASQAKAVCVGEVRYDDITDEKMGLVFCAELNSEGSLKAGYFSMMCTAGNLTGSYRNDVAIMDRGVLRVDKNVPRDIPKQTVGQLLMVAIYSLEGGYKSDAIRAEYEEKTYSLVDELRLGDTLFVRVKGNNTNTINDKFSLIGFSAAYENACAWSPLYR